MSSDVPTAEPIAWVLTGPTGAGKSELALRLAETWGCELIAMDSMTLYRGMDIGTAKPTAHERQRVPHHLIDMLEPWESANVAWWLEQANRCRREIESRGKRVLFVGGTPLYLKALLHGLFEGPPADGELRRRLEQEAQEYGSAQLHQRLATIDPPTAKRLHSNDVRRLVRALEVWELTGKPISSWQQQWQEEPHQPAIRCWWVDRPRPELYARINVRVERMITAGWADEVRRLAELPQPMSREASQALGYPEMRAYVEGKAGLAETVERIQTRSRQFAKRQLTWFRHLPQCKRLPVSGEDWPPLTFWQDFA